MTSTNIFAPTRWLTVIYSSHSINTLALKVHCCIMEKPHLRLQCLASHIKSLIIVYIHITGLLFHNHIYTQSCSLIAPQFSNHSLVAISLYSLIVFVILNLVFTSDCINYINRHSIYIQCFPTQHYPSHHISSHFPVHRIPTHHNFCHSTL